MHIQLELTTVRSAAEGCLVAFITPASIYFDLIDMAARERLDNYVRSLSPIGSKICITISSLPASESFPRLKNYVGKADQTF